MRRLYLFLGAGFLIAVIGSAVALRTLRLHAQARGGRVSPHESVSATIDGARIEITYGRPSMRGRTIFGSLVPYDRVWCPGADEATTLDSPRDLEIESLR